MPNSSTVLASEDGACTSPDDIRQYRQMDGWCHKPNEAWWLRLLIEDPTVIY